MDRARGRVKGVTMMSEHKLHGETEYKLHGETASKCYSLRSPYKSHL